MLQLYKHLRHVTNVTLDAHGQLSLDASALITPSLAGKDTRLGFHGDNKLADAGAVEGVVCLLAALTGQQFVLVREHRGTRFWERADLVRLGASLRARA